MKRRNIEDLKRIRKVSAVGVTTKGSIPGTIILGKRGYLKLQGYGQWMKQEDFLKHHKFDVESSSFFSIKDKGNVYHFTSRSSLGGKYLMWVDNGICSLKSINKEMNSNEGMIYSKSSKAYTRYALAVLDDYLYKYELGGNNNE